MTFWQALKATYGGGFACLAALPLLASVPVIFELVQHVVEVHIGMYDSIASAQAAAGDPWRLGFGFLKVASLTVPLYWINRFLAFRDASFARTASASACRKFAPFVVVQLTIAAISLFVLPQTSLAAVAGLIVTQVIGCLLMAWGVAAPLDNGRVGPVASIAVMRGQLPWTFVFSLVAALPLMVVHYVFAFMAMGAVRSLWPILILDSLLVGCLTAVIAASGFFAATRAATKKGMSLVPSPAPVRLDPVRDSDLRSH